MESNRPPKFALLLRPHGGVRLKAHCGVQLLQADEEIGRLEKSDMAGLWRSAAEASNGRYWRGTRRTTKSGRADRLRLGESAPRGRLGQLPSNPIIGIAL